MAIKNIVSLRFPYLKLELHIRHRKEKIEVLLDTGFDGDIAIPKGMLTNGDIPDGLLPWKLADGSKIIASAYIGKVIIDKIPPLVVTVITMGDEPLIGQGIIKHFAITLDHGKRVILER